MSCRTGTRVPTLLHCTQQTHILTSAIGHCTGVSDCRREIGRQAYTCASKVTVRVQHITPFHHYMCHTVHHYITTCTTQYITTCITQYIITSLHVPHSTLLHVSHSTSLHHYMYHTYITTCITQYIITSLHVPHITSLHHYMYSTCSIHSMVARAKSK